MATPIPLHPHSAQPEEPLDSPDVLILNALLLSGVWNPEQYGINGDMLAGYRHAWAFCQDYQDKTGAPPPIELFARSFPTVEILGGAISVDWAAQKLREAHHEREMRKTLMGAIASLNVQDLEGARAALIEVSKPSLGEIPKGLDSDDPRSVDEDLMSAGFSTMWGRLKAVTGGIGKNQLWYGAARQNVGKSWMAACMAVPAAEDGANVAIASAEMPAAQYTARIHLLRARKDPELQKMLRSTDLDTRRKAVKALPLLPGKITTYDPSQVRFNVTGVEQLAARHHLVVADHMGLMADASNKRSMEDWRVAAVCSNIMREISLRYDTSIFGLVQVNRQGAHAEAMPKLHELSQTDAYGQDGEVVLIWKRMGIGAMRHHVAKNRNHPLETFYTAFEPAKANFAEISKEQARQIDAADQDRSRDA